LATHFAHRAAQRFGLPLALPTDADVEMLRLYAWPGNIRELAAVIDRAAILGEGRRLEIAAALGFSVGSFHDARGATSPISPPQTTTPAGEITTLDEATRRHIIAALAKTRGRIEGARGAAALLAINPHTLRARMRKLAINWSEFRDPS
jgi:DNA-binding NtrC family response regulator